VQSHVQMQVQAAARAGADTAPAQVQAQARPQAHVKQGPRANEPWCRGMQVVLQILRYSQVQALVPAKVQHVLKADADAGARTGAGTGAGAGW
jgi:hypothetical protein